MNRPCWVEVEATGRTAVPSDLSRLLRKKQGEKQGKAAQVLVAAGRWAGVSCWPCFELELGNDGKDCCAPTRRGTCCDALLHCQRRRQGQKGRAAWDGGGWGEARQKTGWKLAAGAYPYSIKSDQTATKLPLERRQRKSLGRHAKECNAGKTGQRKARRARDHSQTSSNRDRPCTSRVIGWGSRGRTCRTGHLSDAQVTPMQQRRRGMPSGTIGLMRCGAGKLALLPQARHAWPCLAPPACLIPACGSPPNLFVGFLSGFFPSAAETFLSRTSHNSAHTHFCHSV